jgi:23S rRNA (pseudouridine1915-N3)-methyltransferase
LITLIAVGKNKDKALQSLEREYAKRLQSFSKVEVVEVKDEANDRVEREGQVSLIKAKEAGRVLSKIKSDDFVILLDLHGTMWSSEEFAQKLDGWQMHHPHMVFVIAGSLGPDDSLVERADIRWKLSPLTFTHMMTRTLVLEQIYRAFTIIHHRSYHK